MISGQCDYDESTWMTQCISFGCTPLECGENNQTNTYVCNQIESEQCNTDYDNCEGNTCDCYGIYGQCMVAANCMNETVFLKECEVIGCSVSQCLANDTVANGTCNFSEEQECTTDYYSCTAGQTEISVVCTCYGIYGQCLVASNCINEAEFMEDCEEASCTEAQCSGNQTTHTCNETEANVCISSYYDCTDNESNFSTICTCYGKWGGCLKSAGCLTGSVFDAYNSACTNAGCTADECKPSSATFATASFAVVAAGSPAARRALGNEIEERFGSMGSLAIGDPLVDTSDIK